MRSSTVTSVALALLWAPVNNAFPVYDGRRTIFPSALSAMTPGANDSNFDWDALDRKNASRKKFGLKPMTPEEFLQNEAAVQQMAAEQQQRAASLREESRTARQSQQQPPSKFVPGFLEKMFGDVLPDTCESNFDCEAPKVCCDFGVSKVCCAGGSKQRSLEGELALVPVPIDVIPDGPYKY